MELSQGDQQDLPISLIFDEEEQVSQKRRGDPKGEGAVPQIHQR